MSTRRKRPLAYRGGSALFRTLTAALTLVAWPLSALAQDAAPEAPPASTPQTSGRTRATPPTGASSDTSPGATGSSEPPEGADKDKDKKKPSLVVGGTTSPKRELPDYDGRGEPETTAGDVALWVPRVALFPAYVVSEFVIRRPLGWFMTTAERNQWPAIIRDLFLFGPEKKAGVVPTAFLDLGFRASVGIYAFWDDLFGKDNHLRLHASTFGTDWLQGSVADRFPIGKDATLDLRVEGAHRPDGVFHDLGPRSTSFRSRYGYDRLVARPVFELTWWRGSRVTVEGGAKVMGFRDDACCDNPSLESRLQQGLMREPPAYRDGYTAVYQRAEVTVDSREERPANQSGFRVELEVEQASNVRKAADNWIRYGGSVGGFLDLKNNRVVSLSATTLFVDPISDRGQIPFTEQVVLGGSGPMRGYLYGRLIDRSAAVATLKYRWPIWVFLDGSMQAALGNVFGPGLDDFKPSLLRFSGAIGVESVGGADHTFEILTGFGTETFEDNLRVTSFRFLFGTNRGF